MVHEEYFPDNQEETNNFRKLEQKIIIAACLFFIFLCLLSVALPPAHAAEINPSVDNQPFFCKYSITRWSPLCTWGNAKVGSGASIFQNLTINVTNFYNGTYGDNSFFNATEIYFENITMQNITINGDVLYYSLMNQTPNMTAGPQGPQGIQGIQGIRGLQGVNGTPGEPGPQGIQGVNGTPGAPGAQGEQGIPGPQGDPGPAGPMGPANMTAGPQGPQGPQGEKGDKGDTGDIGPMGPMNQTPNMTASNLDTSWNVSYLLKSGGIMSGILNAGSNNVSNLSDPAAPQDAATKSYVDTGSGSWSAWTPVTGWSGTTATGFTNVTRYSRLGKTVNLVAEINATDSKGSYLKNFTIPVASAVTRHVQGREYYGTNLGSFNIADFCMSSGSSIVTQCGGAGWSGTNGQPIFYFFSFAYEVT